MRIEDKRTFVFAPNWCSVFLPIVIKVRTIETILKACVGSPFRSSSSSSSTD